MEYQFKYMQISSGGTNKNTNATVSAASAAAANTLTYNQRGEDKQLDVNQSLISNSSGSGES